MEPGFQVYRFDNNQLRRSFTLALYKYVFSVADRRIVCADDTIGSVVSPEFTFKAPHTVGIGVGKSSSEGIDFEHPIKTDIDLSGLFSGKK